MFIIMYLFFKNIICNVVVKLSELLRWFYCLGIVVLGLDFSGGGGGG